MGVSVGGHSPAKFAGWSKDVRENSTSYDAHESRVAQIMSRFFLILFEKSIKSVMKIFETVQPICIFCSFEAIVISIAGCESLLFLLEKNCEDVSKFRIANFLFQGDSSCQQKFFVTKVIHWLVGQKWPKWLLPATLHHQFHCSKLSYGQKWPAKNNWIDGIHCEIGFEQLVEVEKVFDVEWMRCLIVQSFLYSINIIKSSS